MLEITLLGDITVHAHGKPITRFRSQKELTLLAYLAHTGKTHNREALADMLWDARSTKQSLSNLRTALARLRKQVGDHLVITRKTVAVTSAVHEQTDTARFLALLAGAGKERSLTGTNLLVQGLDLYSGEFMAGFSLLNAPRFNDWLVVEQERLRQIALPGYRQLAAWQEEEGAFTAGVDTARLWAAWDPLDETALQQLMRLLAYDGRAAESMGVYEKSRHLLHQELGVPPAPATTALYESIEEGSLAAPDIKPVTPHNLPRALTLLFGREKEIGKITAALVNPAYPLVSITGAGGIGKTSLSLAAGRQLLAGEQHPFNDGIWFVSLEEIENDAPEKVMDRVAALVGQAMGLYFHGQSDLFSQLLGHLASKNLLLILDNIEQFLTVASDLIVDLLQSGEDIHLLVTSRSTLALAAGIAFPIDGLETPAQLSPDALNNESVRLFAERAARMPGPFQLEKHLPEVVAICQFVEGMPLGIELAAASLGRLMIDEILPALSGSLHLLDTTRVDLPPRQRTLHAVFDYSWQLLDPREQNVLVQISVFRDGFTRQAAEAVLHGATSGLYNLQHQALLHRDETGRFRMHPLLRQLAREKLSSPERIELAALTLDRHSSCYADLMSSFEEELQRGIAQEALQTILPEQANLRAAWGHAVRTGQWQTITACLDSTHYFYRRKGFFSEEAALIDDAIATLQATMEEGDRFLTTLLSRLLTIRARNYQNSAQFESGVAFAERSCELAQALQNGALEGQARLAWARLLSIQHEREPALSQFEQVVALAQEAQDQILEAEGWIGIGAQMTWKAEYNLAQEPLRRALELCRAAGYKPGEAAALRLLGRRADQREAFAEALVYHEQALQMSRLLGDMVEEAEVLGSLGVRFAEQADLVTAQTYYQEALTTFRRLNMPESEAWILGELGYATLRLGDFAAAEKQLNEALSISARLEDLFWQGWVKLRLGEMWHKRGEAEKALPLIAEALQAADQFQYLNFRARVLYDWGNVLLFQEDWADAGQKFQEAFDFRYGSGRVELAMPALAGLAYASCQQELPAVAAAHAEQLWQAWQESPVWAERADLELYRRLGLVWDGLGDSRANDLWKKAHALLHQRCEKIPDEQARKMFLERVPAHHAILNTPI